MQFLLSHGLGRGTELAFPLLVRSLRHSLLALLVIVTACVAVGLTAPADSLFSIAIHPVLWRVDAAAIAESRASALGVDIDVKLGAMHVHLGWSALPLS